MEQIRIRKVTVENLFELQEIGKKTFVETFSSSNTEENMKLYLKEGFATEKLTAELPIHAFCLITTLAKSKDLRLAGSIGWFSVIIFTLGPIKTSSSIVIPPKSKKEQP